ncbi:MAG: hypothetical protein M3R41_06705 [Pseudomonadota bacterium]|nr:hypothetical protein [Pseudomonadota bacterium]
MRRVLSLAALPVLLAACHANDRAPGATTAVEDQQLNDAAVMLDANSVDANDADITTINDSDGDGTAND